MSDMMVINFSSFVDRGAVLGPYKRQAVKALGKAGAYSRKDVQRLMKKTKNKSAPPGEAPRYHTAASAFNLRSRIFFGVDRDDLSVLIGPDQKTIKIARTHEEGGYPPVYHIKYSKGQVGPIRKARSGSLYVFVRLRSRKQVLRARSLSLIAQKVTLKRYPRRPFFAPTMPKAETHLLNNLEGMM